MFRCATGPKSRPDRSEILLYMIVTSVVNVFNVLIFINVMTLTNVIIVLLLTIDSVRKALIGNSSFPRLPKRGGSAQKRTPSP